MDGAVRTYAIAVLLSRRPSLACHITDGIDGREGSRSGCLRGPRQNVRISEPQVRCHSRLQRNPCRLRFIACPMFHALLTATAALFWLFSGGLAQNPAIYLREFTTAT